MRLAVALLALTQMLALGALAQSALRDGDLVVAVPPAWEIWRPAEIATANPHVPEGHTVVGMAAEHRLGHPAPQATVTLERLDLRRLGFTDMDAVQLAETHLLQMRRDAPGFEAEGGVFPTRLGDRPAQGWQGLLPLPMGEGTLRVRVWQTVTVQGDIAHLLTFYLPEQGELAPPGDPRERPAPPPVAPAPVPSSPEWTLGSFTMPLPARWVGWPQAEIDQMRRTARQADARVVDVNGITLPGAQTGDFQPSVAAATLTLAGPLSGERLRELAAESAQHMVAGTLSGEIALEATAFQMGPRPAAIAVVSGAMMDRGALRPVRIDQIWLDGGQTALRFVIITDLDDEATRGRIGQMLAALRE